MGSQFSEFGRPCLPAQERALDGSIPGREGEYEVPLPQDEAGREEKHHGRPQEPLRRFLFGDRASKETARTAQKTQEPQERRGYLLIDRINVTIKIAEISIRPPAAIRPRETKKMVPAPAESHVCVAQTKANSEAKKVSRIRIMPPGRSLIWMAVFSTA